MECPGEDPLPALQRCVSLLRWQLLTREGDLYLSAVAPLVRGLADPDAAWVALLTALPCLLTDLMPVTSVTDRRRNQDGSLDVVALPPEAEELLERSPAGASWFLDELVTPAVLRAATTAAGA